MSLRTPDPLSAFRGGSGNETNCKRRKAGRGLGTRLTSTDYYVCSYSVYSTSSATDGTVNVSSLSLYSITREHAGHVWSERERVVSVGH